MQCNRTGVVSQLRTVQKAFTSAFLNAFLFRDARSGYCHMMPSAFASNRVKGQKRHRRACIAPTAKMQLQTETFSKVRMCEIRIKSRFSRIKCLSHSSNRRSACILIHKEYRNIHVFPNPLVRFEEENSRTLPFITDPGC